MLKYCVFKRNTGHHPNHLIPLPQMSADLPQGNSEMTTPLLWTGCKSPDVPDTSREHSLHTRLGHQSHYLPWIQYIIAPTQTTSYFSHQDSFPFLFFIHSYSVVVRTEHFNSDFIAHDALHGWAIIMCTIPGVSSSHAVSEAGSLPIYPHYRRLIQKTINAAVTTTI